MCMYDNVQQEDREIDGILNYSKLLVSPWNCKIVASGYLKNYLSA